MSVRANWLRFRDRRTAGQIRLQDDPSGRQVRVHSHFTNI